MDPFRIAIVGAGPAGLALARIIAIKVTGAKAQSQSSHVPHPFTIILFERDVSPTDPIYRPQGGSLDLHATSGQKAVKGCQSWDEFLWRARYDSQEALMVDKYWNVIGKSDDFDLVIGADGCWSRVRPTLTKTKPTYTNRCAIETHLSNNIQQIYPALADLPRKGAFFASSDGKVLAAQYNPEYVRVYTVLPEEEQRANTKGGLDWNDSSTARH